MRRIGGDQRSHELAVLHVHRRPGNAYADVFERPPALAHGRIWCGIRVFVRGGGDGRFSRIDMSSFTPIGIQNRQRDTCGQRVVSDVVVILFVACAFRQSPFV